MPRYYVRLEPGGAGDEDGEWLPGPAAAKKMVEAMANDLTKNRDEGCQYQRIVVKDETGAVIHERALVVH